MKVWVVTVAFQDGNSKLPGSIHSVWQTRQKAENQANLRNKIARQEGLRLGYSVKERNACLFDNYTVGNHVIIDGVSGAFELIS